MSNCASIDPLVTAYVDGEIETADRQVIDDHIQRCPPCRARIVAERAVRKLCRERKAALQANFAPDALRARCVGLKNESLSRPPTGLRGPAEAVHVKPRVGLRDRPVAGWSARFGPLAMAASLVLLVAAAFLYQLTSSSNRVMAAELTADHVKCFAMNAMLGTHQTPDVVESSMASTFGWNVELPTAAAEEGIELVGSRPCLYAEGRVAHIMYRHNGQPVSLFMLPKTSRKAELVGVFGHEAAIWSVGNHTFVLIARESQADVKRLVEFVRASVR